MPGSGYALMLQVAHPVVGAGVSEHSNFRADPWGRLLRTLDFTTSMVYGGPELAWDTGRRVREMHKQIKGKLPNGEPYHSLEPEAYAWVHATLADSIVRSHERFVGPVGDPSSRRSGPSGGASGGCWASAIATFPSAGPSFPEYFDR